jgi:hypothetical protein
MNLGLKPQFVPYVRDGSKRHTIRGGERWRPGMRADLWENIRRPKKFDADGNQIAGQQLIFRAEVTRVQSIRIGLIRVAPPFLAVVLDDDPGESWLQCPGMLSEDETEYFFWRDGFRKGWEGGFDPTLFDKLHERRSPMNQAFHFWFKQLREGQFAGQLIHWDFDKRTTEKS